MNVNLMKGKSTTIANGPAQVMCKQNLNVRASVFTPKLACGTSNSVGANLFQDHLNVNSWMVLYYVCMSHSNTAILIPNYFDNAGTHSFPPNVNYVLP